MLESPFTQGTMSKSPSIGDGPFSSNSVHLFCARFDPGVCESPLKHRAETKFPSSADLVQEENWVSLPELAGSPLTLNN